MQDGKRERLNSWKEIADFLQRSEKTARRWEMQRNLPVHRVPGAGKGSVYAYRDELENWLRTAPAESSSLDLQAVPTGDARPAKSKGSKLPLAGALLLVSGLIAYLLVSPARPRRLSPEGPKPLNQSAAAKYPPLISDGRYLYYQEIDQGRIQMSRTSLDGSPVTTPLEIPLQRPDPGVVASDGSAMLLRNLQGDGTGDQPLYLQPLPSGAPVRLGSIFAYDSAWTPDRKQIVFGRSRAVFEARADGSHVRKLFDVPGWAHWFRWSPDGRKVRFTVYESTKVLRSIWEMGSDYSHPGPADFGLPEGARYCCGNWDPDGRRFYFQVSVAGFWHIYSYVEPSCRGPWTRHPAVQLTSGMADHSSPLPLADERSLALLHQVVKSELSQYDRTRGRWLPLVEGVPATTGAFRRDGGALAFTRVPGRALWRCDMPGCRDQVQLTKGPEAITMPRWSPDGEWIACMASTPGSPWRVIVVPSRGGGEVMALTDGTSPEADPTWSPTGDEIAFGGLPNPDVSKQRTIRIIHLKTRAVREVPDSRGFDTPNWSPDGRYLAAVRADTRELAFHDFETGRWRVVAGTSAGYLNWSADGSKLYFYSPVSQKMEIRCADPRSDEVLPVASFEGIRRPAFAFGDWVGLGPGDTPLALRDLSTVAVVRWKLDDR